MNGLVSSEQFAIGPDGTRLYVRQQKRDDADGARDAAGQGSPAVTALLSDGIACDGFIWKYMWDELAKHVDVAHWHYRGHGRSSPPVDPERIALVDHATDLGVVREHIGDPPVVLFGHSMGCQVSLEAYRQRRDKVRGLVLLCGSSGRVTYTFKGTDALARALPRLIESVEAHPNFARAVWGNVPPEVAVKIAALTGEIDTSSMNPEDLLPYLKHIVTIDLLMYLRMLKSAGEHSAADLLPEIEVPVLVVAGDKDSFTPPRYAEEMAAALPNGELLMVSGTHVAPIEQKELVHERITTFLRERVGVE
jgi:pimeloyl-ACP methyl ester carboxylesterase